MQIDIYLLEGILCSLLFGLTLHFYFYFFNTVSYCVYFDRILSIVSILNHIMIFVIGEVLVVDDTFLVT